MGWLTFLYLASFILGLTFTVAAFLLSGMDRVSRVVAQSSKNNFNSWLNFNAMAVLLTWFGAAGFIFRSLKFGEELTLALAILGGLAGYALILLYALRQSNAKRVAAPSLKGTVARVSQPAAGRSEAEIVFYLQGMHLAVPARSADGRSLTPGTQVVILNQEKGVALVEDLDRFLVKNGAEKWATNQLKSGRS